MSVQVLIDKAVGKMGKGIHPVVRDSVIELIKRCYVEDIYILIAQGHRTMEEQAALYGKGRNSFIYKGRQYAKPLEAKVTNAKPGSSYHNFGLAVDYVLTDIEGKSTLWMVNKQWRRVAAIAKSLGFAWGGDWSSFKDYPHLEMTGGLSTSDLRAGRKPNISLKFEKPTVTSSEEKEKKEEKDVPKTDGIKLPESLAKEMSTVLLRFSKKENNPHGTEWRDKFLKGELNTEDAVGLLYSAVYRGFIGEAAKVGQLQKKLETLEQEVQELKGVKQ